MTRRGSRKAAPSSTPSTSTTRGSDDRPPTVHAPRAAPLLPAARHHRLRGPRQQFRWLDERQFLDGVAVVALLVLTRFRGVPEPLVIAVAGALGILIGGPSPP